VLSYEAEADGMDADGTDADDPLKEALFPVFDYRLRFKISSPSEESYHAGQPETVENHLGYIKLVNISADGGRLTVTGNPRFLMNGNLSRDANARLAWNILAAKDGSVLFIRGKRIIKSFFGRFAERGNFIPLCVSLAVLVIAGFWMVIPVFGLVRGEEKRRLRPIQERFRAETRLLKKYDSLGIYLDPLLREIRGRKMTDGEIDKIEASLHSGKKMRYKEIIRDLLILEKTMERL
jgi:hypothetical protein